MPTPNHFLFVEHPHVYTLGKSGDMSNLLVDEAQLKAKGATFYKINRGGDITYHGPGQIAVTHALGDECVDALLRGGREARDRWRRRDRVVG